MSYCELTMTERSSLQVALAQQMSFRAIAKLLKRAPSTISREVRRHARSRQQYQANKAQDNRHYRRLLCRPKRKLLPGTERFELITHMLKKYFAPEQIAGQLKTMDIPHYATLMCAKKRSTPPFYALPVGQLRHELIHCLRHGRSQRKPRTGGVDRRGQLPERGSIHLRPPEVDKRVIQGHWEGDLIKGKNNASAVGTLVELTSGYVMLVKMNGATATAAVEGFSAALNRMPLSLRKTMTYDQGKEMARHAEITQNTGVGIYFCDPHSPWQRGANENINGLIRQYLPKGTDLSVHSQTELNEIALSRNMRPRKRFGFKCPIEQLTKVMLAEENKKAVTH